jgi:16S rRNA (guanine966-N2)-methyltransferase
MRIVAGALRGRRIAAPDGRVTRPTTDRVREAVFNALASLDAVIDAAVVDLYAGSGALGLEALSRGARHCTFVERDRAAARVIEANIDALGVRDRARVLVGDGIALAVQLEADLVFADPPYGFDDWPRLLRAVRSDFVVAEAAAPVPAPVGWDQARVKRYGRTWVTFLHREGDETDETASAELP